MRSSSTQLRDYLAAFNVADRADLWTVTTRLGVVYRWTSWRWNLIVAGQTYSAASPVLRRGRTRVTAAPEVDTLDVELASAFDFGGKPLLIAALDGVLEEAAVQLDHLVMQTPGDASFGPVRLFDGTVADLDGDAGGVLRMRVKSALERANRPLPHRLYQPTCGWDLFDADCGLSRAAYTIGVIATTGSAATEVHFAHAAANGYWANGVVAFSPTTGGANAGLSRDVVSWTTGGIATIAPPLPYTPAVGDEFTIAPGCDKSKGAGGCAKFSNLTHFGGFPYIPSTASAT